MCFLKKYSTVDGIPIWPPRVSSPLMAGEKLLGENPQKIKMHKILIKRVTGNTRKF